LKSKVAAEVVPARETPNSVTFCLRDPDSGRETLPSFVEVLAAIGDAASTKRMAVARALAKQMLEGRGETLTEDAIDRDRFNQSADLSHLSQKDFCQN